MKTLLTIAILALLAGATLADPVVVGFDEFIDLTPLEAGYGGVMAWNNWAATTSSESYPALSPTNIAINIGLPTPIEFGQEVYLIGFSYTGPNPGVFPYHLKLMLGDEVVFEIPEFHVNGEAFLWEVPYDGLIDSMIIDQIPGMPYGFFCIDDLTYEPGTVPTDAVSLSTVKSLFQ